MVTCPVFFETSFRDKAKASYQLKTCPTNSLSPPPGVFPLQIEANPIAED